MTKNAFVGRTTKPADPDLTTALGPAKNAWDELLAALDAELGVGVHEWKCHAPKWGWALRVCRKKRTIVWLSPAEGAFEALFILGERAMQAARGAKLPKIAMRVLQNAPKYPEGTGARFVVKSPRSVRLLKQLAAIKVAN